MRAIVRLETSRLELLPLELADAEQAQQLFPKWEIVRYLANRVPWPYLEDGSSSYYRDVALIPADDLSRIHRSLTPFATILDTPLPRG
jgi:hypothetical protein